jgi:hypothetical protein
LDATLPDAQSKLDTQTTYAWNWFAYHAGQRLTAFNFFLVIVGVLTVGYGQAVENRWEGVGIAVGLLGAVVGVGFLVLDVRNKDLVDAGTNALVGLETDLDVHIVTDSYGIKVTRKLLLSHTIVLRTVEVLVALTFAAGVAWAATNYSGVHPHVAPAAETASVINSR